MIEKNLIRVEFTLTKWNSLLQLSSAEVNPIFTISDVAFKTTNFGKEYNIIRLIKECEYRKRSDHGINSRNH